MLLHVVHVHDVTKYMYMYLHVYTCVIISIISASQYYLICLCTHVHSYVKKIELCFRRHWGSDGKFDNLPPSISLTTGSHTMCSHASISEIISFYVCWNRHQREAYCVPVVFVRLFITSDQVLFETQYCSHIHVLQYSLS